MDDVADEVRRLTVQIRALVSELADHERDKNHIEVTHTQVGMGNWAAAAVTACFMTYLALILFGVWTIFQVNDLKAWSSVYGRDLAGMKNELQHREKP